MTDEEFNEQLQAATQFIIYSKEESVNYKESADLYKKANDKTIEIIKELIPKEIPATITEESLTKIFDIVESALKRCTASSQCQMSSKQGLVDQLSGLVLKKVADAMDETIARSAERHSARIKVYHEHHHINMYGRFASSETNRKMMCWLGFISILSIAGLVVFLLDWYNVIEWDEQVIVYGYFAIIVIAVIGLILHWLLSK